MIRTGNGMIRTVNGLETRARAQQRQSKRRVLCSARRRAVRARVRRGRRARARRVRCGRRQRALRRARPALAARGGGARLRWMDGWMDGCLSVDT